MKLSPQQITQCPSHISPTSERVISLRSLHLTNIDSLEILESSDIFECIDLSNNGLIILPALPHLFRLKTVLVARNNIRIIDDNFAKLVPHLQTVSLCNNSLTNLLDLESLLTVKDLQNLYLIGNPVSKLVNYRRWCIWRFPNLKVLDFEKIKDIERKKSIELFGTADNLTDLAKEILNNGEKQGEIAEEELLIDEIDISVKKLTPIEREKLSEKLIASKSLEEIEEIENILKRGYL